MQVLVDRIRDLNSRVREFTLRAADGRDLPPAYPGSHLSVSVVLPGSRAGHRKYSILSNPLQSSMYQIAVKRDQASTGGSIYMHEQVRVGQNLEVTRPVDGFPLRLTGQRVVLVAGGIGITPLLSMMHVLHGIGIEFEVHYASRKLSEHLYRERILELSGGNASFYHSEGNGAHRLDVCRLFSGMGHGADVYACGPQRLYRACRDLVQAGAIAQDKFHFERFGVDPKDNGRRAQAILSESGKTIDIRENQSILSALTEAKVAVPYDCLRGECGMCAVPYIDGEVVHRDSCLSDGAREQRVCVCVSKVRSDKITLAV